MTTMNRSKDKKEVRDVRTEALKIANSQHIEGQTKEETRLIAKGIQRGMEQYLRQQSEKTRELDKKVKKVKQLAGAVASQQMHIHAHPAKTSTSLKKIPWILLGISWLIFLVLWWLRV